MCICVAGEGSESLPDIFSESCWELPLRQTKSTSRPPVHDAVTASLGITNQLAEEPMLAVLHRRKTTYLTSPEYRLDVDTLSEAGYYFGGESSGYYFGGESSYR